MIISIAIRKYQNIPCDMSPNELKAFLKEGEIFSAKYIAHIPIQQSMEVIQASLGWERAKSL